ncbi:metalloaminopeptidase [Branchiostoma belcheri]|nr:metalloaminopeptidase [Branchiostoma belcheri]
MATNEELQTLRPSASGQGFHQGDGTVYVTNALNTDKLFTQVHYLKGYFLLRYFAKKVGADKFQSLLKSFVQEFPRHGMNLIFSQDFFKLVFKTFPSLTSQAMGNDVPNANELECSGQLHDNQSDVPLTSDLPATSLVHEGGVSTHDSRAKEPGRELLQDQLVLLLEELLEVKSMAGATLQQLEEHYRLSRCNADVRHRWCELVIKHGYSPGYSDVQRFLCEDQAMGVYLYGELMMYQRPQQQQLARDTFQLLSQEMEEGPRKAVQDMLYGGQGDDQAMGV